MPSIEEVLELEGITGLRNEEALEAVALLVDHAGDVGDLELAAKALTWSEELGARSLSAEDLAILDYFRANAWACRYTARHRDRVAVWAWEQPELQQQVFFLRRALNSPAFPQIHVFRRCQILTNLGNQLDTVGRFVEARAYWTEALRLEPRFWMARANRGRALMHYANALYDPGHREVFALYAHRDLLAAVVAMSDEPGFGDTALLPLFADSAASIGRAYNLEAIEAAYKPDTQDLGMDRAERDYRRCCLQHVLFLNPLNDLEPRPIAARDVMTLPSFVTGIDESPVLVGFFNQLKQEFVSARWIYYEACSPSEPHLSDRDVLLYNTLDYPAYGLSVEKVKLAFRMAYSIFDKIAFFLNRYLSLGIPEKRVSFRSIWMDKQDRSIRAQFDASENWPFRGLYWLSKDLFEDEMRDVTEPDAQQLHDIRNHLEHKYIKVHEMYVPRAGENGAELDPFFDDLAYAISRGDLERKTLRLLKLVRTALIYLSLGMHREEQRRGAETRDAKRRIMQIPLDVWRDEWKR